KYRSEPFMSEYFLSHWDGAAPPTEWAMIYRARDVPTGDQALEGYHLRLERHVFKGLHEQSLVNVFLRFDNEMRHWETIFSNPRSLESRMEEADRRARGRS